jgi:hypothetical protein
MKRRCLFLCGFVPDSLCPGRRETEARSLLTVVGGPAVRRSIRSPEARGEPLGSEEIFV